MNHQPPLFAQKLLRRFCHVTLIEEIEGDLDEQFNERVNEIGLSNARLFYIKEVVFAIFTNRRARTRGVNKHQISPIDALMHFTKVSFRNLKSNLSSSLINIGGLALSITSFLLIYLYLYDELTYDSFHPNAENVYRISGSYMRYGDGARETDARAGGLWVVSLKESLPQAKAFTRFSRFGYPGNVKYEKGDKFFVEQEFFWVDPSYTTIFKIDMVDGRDASQILKDPQYVIVNEKTARKYFGSLDPVGETFVYNRDGMDISLIVGGVMNDYPSNVHFHPDFIASNVALTALWKMADEDRVNSWYDSFTYSFVALESGTSPSVALNELKRIFRVHVTENKSLTPVLTRLSDVHFTQGMLIELENPGDRIYLFIFGSIGALILIIAAINYMNLATARSVKRSKEVALRKTLGVRRSSLVMQFLGESFVMIILAFVLSLALLLLLFPAFNELTGKSFSIHSLEGWKIWGILLSMVVSLGLLAGSYPAFYLSRFRPAEVLKGQFISSGSAETFRRVLVVFQFSITIMLIISTAVIHSQMGLIHDTKLAAHNDQIITVRTSGVDDKVKLSAFRNLVLQHVDVKKVAASDHLPKQENFGWSDHPFTIPSIGSDEHMWDQMHCDSEFASMFNIELVAGRNFSDKVLADSSAFILNESAVKELGLTAEEVIGREIQSKFWEPQFNMKGTIVGVVKDFNYRSVRRKISPMVLCGASNRAETVNIMIAGNNYNESIAYFEQSWKKVYPASPFQHWFMDQEIEKLYRGEIQMQKVSDYFSAFTIVIACLGLFGLASFTAEQKTKEIGIRKVLGATLGQILSLLTNRFVRLIMIAYVIAIPATIVAMHFWLQNFNYKVELDWTVFALAGCFMLILTYATVGVVSSRAAMRNPADVIRHE